MSVKNIPPCPPSLKSIQHYLKTASEHDERDVVVAYWCRLYALQLGLKLDKSSPEAKKLLCFLMDWLEKVKIEQKDNEAVVHDVPAQAHLENYALKIFLWADSQDRASIFNKNVVKAFYTAGMIYDVLETFGELTEEVQQNRKYAKWKAAYIHNCLKNGETPIPGPMDDGTEDMPNILVPGGSGITPPPNILDVPSTSKINPQQPPLLPTVHSDPKPGTPTNASVPDFSEPDKIPAAAGTGSRLTPEQISKAQKYCKFASSALNYDDVPTAINNLEKALRLLTTGAD